MKFDPQRHHRRSIRLKGYDYTQEGAYYITIVAHQREHLFGEVVNAEMQLNKFGLVAEQQWEKLPRRFNHVELIDFVIMPNHMHGIIVIMGECRGTAESTQSADSSLICRAPTAEGRENRDREASRRVPTGLSHHIALEANIEKFGKPIAGSIPTIIRSYKSAVAFRINLMRGTKGLPVWQSNYYEHVIRDEKDLQAKCDYILSNPLNWEEDDENIKR